MQYGLIGEKLSHSFSKEIHESMADYVYELCEISRENLGAFLEKREFSAINVTMPYKKEVIPHLDEVSAVANDLQAVNCIVNKNGKLFGYNTDYFGMRDLILRSGIELSGKKALILGTGGTSRTSALVCRDLGAVEIIKVSRSKAEVSITYDEAYEKHFDADVIINTTPINFAIYLSNKNITAVKIIGSKCDNTAAPKHAAISSQPSIPLITLLGGHAPAININVRIPKNPSDIKNNASRTQPDLSS